MSSASILIVDEASAFLNAVEDSLYSAGYAVYLRTTAFGLAGALRQIRPKMLVLNIWMPGLRGDKALRLVADLEDSHLPDRLILTGLGPLEVLRHIAMDLHADTFIHYPTNVEHFTDTIRGWMPSTELLMRSIQATAVA